MWTYQINGSSLDANGNVIVNVNFTNGSQTISRQLNVSSINTLKLQIQNTLDNLTNNEAVITQIQAGITDLTIQVSDQEQAQIDYDQQRQKLVVAKQNLDLGLIQQSDFDSLQSNTLTSLTKLNNQIQTNNSKGLAT